MTLAYWQIARVKRRHWERVHERQKPTNSRLPKPERLLKLLADRVAQNTVMVTAIRMVMDSDTETASRGLDAHAKTLRKGSEARSAQTAERVAVTKALA